MRPFLKYLAYVVRHKRFVYQEGRKLGLGRWQLLLHDWHKLLPDEFSPYKTWFYDYGGSWYAAPDVMGPNGEGMFAAYLKPFRQQAFDRAWLKHQRRSLHHWQARVLLEDSGKVKVLPMPDRYRREMLADWRGAGRAIHGRDETASWYLKTLNGRKLHPDTQAWVEAELGIFTLSLTFEPEPLKREAS